jgi:hypothetical protein
MSGNPIYMSAVYVASNDAPYVAVDGEMAKYTTRCATNIEVYVHIHTMQARALQNAVHISKITRPIVKVL